MSNKNLLILNIFFIFSLLTACSINSKKIIPLKTLSSKAKWFKGNEKFRQKYFDKPNSFSYIHPFFDLRAYMAIKDQSVNMVILTRSSSLYEYQVDLKSGRSYKKRKYCEEDDIWQSYKGNIYKPPFTMGFIPRLLDQRGLPQKIITFGEEKYFPSIKEDLSASVRVRVVGGVIEQYCPQYPCTLRNRWLSRVILIAINPNDPKFENIVHFDELKKVVDWDYMRAFLENSNGRNIKSVKELPSFRVIGNFGPNESLRLARKKGHFFTDKEITKLQSNCFSLYDFLWAKVKFIRREKALSKKEGIKDLLDTSREDFSKFMKLVSSKYQNRFMLCQKYVRAGSINHDTERLWFFTYLNAFFSLQKMGDVYSCKYNSWVQNPYLASGKRIYDPMKEINRCKTEDLNKAFFKIMTSLAARQGSFQQYIRYITYDNSRGGSHQKIYSWIFEDSNHQSCKEKKSYKIRKVLPHNVEWKSF